MYLYLYCNYVIGSLLGYDMTGEERLSRDVLWARTWNFRVSLRTVRPGGSNQQLSIQRMSVYIDRFYSEGSLYIYCLNV